MNFLETFNALNSLYEGTDYELNAGKVLVNAGLCNTEADGKAKIFRIKNEIHAFVHAPNWLTKYLKGIARLITENVASEAAIEDFIKAEKNFFNDYLTWVKLNRNEKNAKELDKAFIEIKSLAELKADLETFYNSTSNTNQFELDPAFLKNKPVYDLIPIHNYRDLHLTFGGTYTGDGSTFSSAWCHTNKKDTYDEFIEGGNRFYILAARGWEDIEFDPESNKINPKDEYGLSLIALVVTSTGRLKYATLRCNHVGVGANADNQFTNYAELSRLAGFNVEEQINSSYDSTVMREKATKANERFIKICTEIETGTLTRHDIDTVAEWLTEAIIPDNIVNIHRNCFIDCIQLERIILPDTLAYLDDHAFAGCDALSEIKIPDNTVKEIPSSCFSGCAALEKIKLPNGVTEIGDWAFYNCINLKKVVVPDTLEKIKEQAFIKCENLEEFIIPKNVKFVGDRAFYKTKTKVIDNAINHDRWSTTWNNR